MTTHSFYMPVMGIGFSIDTPIKVAPYGISSVISLIDDDMFEKIREVHCSSRNMTFVPILKTEDDFRAKRITAYLNFIDNIVKEDITKLKSSPFDNGSQIVKYFELLPDDSKLKRLYKTMVQTEDTQTAQRLQSQLRKEVIPGSVDVNIMTCIDRSHYKEGEELSVENNDAHAALRGFALSNLNSSVVFSAGINKKLYGYASSFSDFYPDENGYCRKKIILKVSDFRSAMTQGKFLAKKGLWVSEYRIESGMNCGGHAFPTKGLLLGPVMEQFKQRKEELLLSSHELYVKALQGKDYFIPDAPMDARVTVQGGVGTAAEHRLLLDYYKVDAVGWGSPFLLVPEATNVDSDTLKILSDAGEKELYLSESASPLGFPYNTVKGNTKDIEKQNLIKEGTPGVKCTKRYFVLNTEFTKRPVCTASRQYQSLRIDALNQQNPNQDEYEDLFANITDKECICVGLGTSALLVNDLDITTEGNGASVCPGPNLAYFSKIVSLKEMVDHIYGRLNIANGTNRPHMFIKEISMYFDYIRKHENLYTDLARDNSNKGVDYYKHIFSAIVPNPEDVKNKLMKTLEESKNIFP